MPSGFAAFEILGDDICSVVSEYSCFEAEIERARRGELAQSNSTLVNPRKNLPPIKEKYSTQISLTTDTDGNTHVAAIALVSDDGCDVRVNGTQWLNESGKGHDISTGVRRYGELLLPGDENRFDIEYSQTFYDPAVLENDLDGLTMVVMPIPIDISVKDSSGKMNDRILVKKGETIEVALHPMFWEHDLPGNDKIEWILEQITYTGKFVARKLDETGAKISLKMDTAGIFRICAVINGERYYYLRHEDAVNSGSFSLLKRGYIDAIGVCEADYEIQMVNNAYAYCSHASKKFAKASTIKPGYGVTSPIDCFLQENDYADAWKCNIFVFVVENESLIAVRPCKRNQKIQILGGTIFEHIYYSPPTVSEMNNPTFRIPLVVGQSPHFSPEEIELRPGIVIMDSQHTGILDYDGFWINAGEAEVHKRFFLTNTRIRSLRVYELNF